MRTRIVLIIVLLGVLAACGGSDDGGRPVIAASFYPLAFAAQEVAGPAYDVENLTPPGAEPHDLDVSPDDVRVLESAELVVLMGGGFQPTLEDAAAEGEGVLRVLELPGLRVLPDGDPHVWLDPLRYALITRRIAARLGDARRAEPLVARLRALDGELGRGLAQCRRRELVTSHAAYGYLAERYGLEQIAITGLSPEGEPSPRDLERTIERVRDSGATTVFFEPLISPELAETVARETGTHARRLDPIEGLTEEQVEQEADYFSIMRANLAALRGALGCR